LNLTVPSLGESIVEAEIEKWQKKAGDWVQKDETLVTIASDKATVEVPAPAAGLVKKLLKGDGDKVKIGEVIAEIDESAKPPAGKAAAPAEKAAAKAEPPRPVVAVPPAPQAPSGPAARRAMAEAGLTAAQVQGSGPGGRILKEDVARAEQQEARTEAPMPTLVPASAPAGREEQVVRMTKLRRTIAERLVRAKQSTAMLTTFNEIDMSRAMELRKQYQDRFLEKYGIKLGFMSFFVKGAIEALKAFPAVNAEIRGEDIVYKNFYDIGVAVGSGRGLTVPVIRDADTLSFSEVEKVIAELGVRARDNKLTVEELQGGTFTISNGGIYGSLLSTPILNPPQSGILGMHKIEERPVVQGGQIVARPMMYVALSYDHRIVDGREAVGFLVRIKECVENPERVLLEV
jgi:2-oxoglutarate dehydrogenase E2 component (dihydrolipoamide succinyltransferase)